VIEMHVLLDDDQGQLTLKRLWLWHRILARSQAARLDRKLAEGASPETSASLAARATELTSMEFRRDLAVSLRGILAAAGEPVPAVWPRSPIGPARTPRIPLRVARIRRSAPALTELISALLQPGPVPVRGVAMVTRLLADGVGPLYWDVARDDLNAVAARTVAALTW
jgi:hypothetical protein